MTLSENEFTFKYIGTNEIEINVLIESLTNVAQGLKQISIEETGLEVPVHVKPFKEGSFEYILSLIEDPATVVNPTLLLGAVQGKKIIELFKNVVEVVKFFKGEKVTPGKKVGSDNYEIKTKDGDVKIIHGNADTIGTIINGDNAVIINIENVFLGAASDSNIDGFKILNSAGKAIATVSKKDIKETATKISDRRNTPRPAEQTQTRNVTKEKVYLSTSKPDLAADTLWNVVYEGVPVRVKITDVEFLDEVHKRKHPFYNGTRLYVDMIIKQNFSPKHQAYTNSSFIVTKVHKVVQENEQKSILDGDKD